MSDKEFLDSLKGLPLSEAEEQIERIGYKVFLVPEECSVALMAYPNTVIIFQKNGLVDGVMNGDPCKPLPSGFTL